MELLTGPLHPTSVLSPFQVAVDELRLNSLPFFYPPDALENYLPPESIVFLHGFLSPNLCSSLKTWLSAPASGTSGATPGSTIFMICALTLLASLNAPPGFLRFPCASQPQPSNSCPLQKHCLKAVEMLYNYPAIIQKFLSNAPKGDSSPLINSDAPNTLDALVTANERVQAQNVMDKTVANILLAALGLRLAIESFPIPEGWNELESCGVAPESVACFCRLKSPSVHSGPRVMLLPLHLALSISPMLLLIPKSFINKSVSRAWLFKIWLHLGSERPECITKIERAIWNAVHEVARAPSSLNSALGTLHAALKELEGPMVSKEDQSFFRQLQSITTESSSTASVAPTLPPPATTGFQPELPNPNRFRQAVTTPATIPVNFPRTIFRVAMPSDRPPSQPIQNSVLASVKSLFSSCLCLFLHSKPCTTTRSGFTIDSHVNTFVNLLLLLPLLPHAIPSQPSDPDSPLTAASTRRPSPSSPAPTSPATPSPPSDPDCPSTPTLSRPQSLSSAPTPTFTATPSQPSESNSPSPPNSPPTSPPTSPQAPRSISRSPSPPRDPSDDGSAPRKIAAMGPKSTSKPRKITIVGPAGPPPRTGQKRKRASSSGGEYDGDDSEYLPEVVDSSANDVQGTNPRTLRPKRATNPINPLWFKVPRTAKKRRLCHDIASTTYDSHNSLGPAPSPGLGENVMSLCDLPVIYDVHGEPVQVKPIVSNPQYGRVLQALFQGMLQSSLDLPPQYTSSTRGRGLMIQALNYEAYERLSFRGLDIHLKDGPVLITGVPEHVQPNTFREAILSMERPLDTELLCCDLSLPPGPNGTGQWRKVSLKELVRVCADPDQENHLACSPLPGPLSANLPFVHEDTLDRVCYRASWTYGDQRPPPDLSILQWDTVSTPWNFGCVRVHTSGFLSVISPVWGRILYAVFRRKDDPHGFRPIDWNNVTAVLTSSEYDVDYAVLEPGTTMFLPAGCPYAVLHLDEPTVAHGSLHYLGGSIVKHMFGFLHNAAMPRIADTTVHHDIRKNR
ncbi:hypothetical protein ONZ45_g12442 [Pleurotus djamor]|nr:hypothetical protein ONZ45_g12442 [Pleurotus djamor]